jgi:hypothetical protein
MVASARKLLFGGATLALAAISTPAHAEDVRFGVNDVPTVFFINKSNDKNRVDYGIRLDSNCAPVNGDAVFAYWRNFEDAPPVKMHFISFIERVPYGFAEQRTVKKGEAGGEQLIRLRQFDRPITIVSKRDGARCVAEAHATVANNKNGHLLSVFAKLAGPISVDYIDVHGKDLTTGAVLEERIKK